MNRQHIPVALERCIELLTPAIEFSLQNDPSTYVVDATLGLGGHTRALLAKFPTLIIIGIDRDERAIAIARENVAPFANRLLISHTTYDQIDAVLQEHGIEKIAGILFDLGVSSMQLDDGDRGFAYSRDAPLDMRMDQSEAGKLNTTKDLAELVKNAIPAAARRTGGNPAKRTFQALRIEVNQELAILERAIPAALAALEVHGRLVVMAYQSLEDKIVKSVLAEATASKTPRGLPVDLPDSAAKFELVMRGSESAAESEIVLNPRAQSMRLRAVERLAA